MLTLTTWAVMQALMDVDITVEAERLATFWTGYMGSRFVSCKDDASENEIQDEEF